MSILENTNPDPSFAGTTYIPVLRERERERERWEIGRNRSHKWYVAMQITLWNVLNRTSSRNFIGLVWCQKAWKQTHIGKTATKIRCHHDDERICTKRLLTVFVMSFGEKKRGQSHPGGDIFETPNFLLTWWPIMTIPTLALAVLLIMIHATIVATGDGFVFLFIYFF